MNSSNDCHYLTMAGSALAQIPPGFSEPLLYAPLFLDRIYELDIIKYLLELNTANDCFVDIGSHIGFYAIPMSYKFKQVIAYEPSLFQFNYLLQNIALNKIKNITAKKNAVGSKNMQTTLYVMGRSGGSNTLSEEVAKSQNPMTNYLVDVRTLDSENLNSLSLLKIDVEGLELDVLQGAKHSIKKFQPVIVVEVWEDNTRRKKVVDFLHLLGYKVDFIFPNFPEIALCLPTIGQ